MADLLEDSPRRHLAKHDGRVGMQERHIDHRRFEPDFREVRIPGVDRGAVMNDVRCVEVQVLRAGGDRVVNPAGDAELVDAACRLDAGVCAVEPPGRGHPPGDREVECVVRRFVGDADSPANRGRDPALVAEVRSLLRRRVTPRAEIDWVVREQPAGGRHPDRGEVVHRAAIPADEVEPLTPPLGRRRVEGAGLGRLVGPERLDAGRDRQFRQPDLGRINEIRPPGCIHPGQLTAIETEHRSPEVNFGHRVAAPVA